MIYHIDGILLFLPVTPRKTADGPLGIGGRSARVTPRYLVGCGPGRHLLLPHSHLDQRQAELVCSRRRRLLPSISLLRPPYFDSSREHLTQHLLHLPQPPGQLLPAGIAPATAGHHWSRLKLCSTVDPLLRSSSARTDRGNGIVVSHLGPLAFFPLPLCAAGAGEPPSLPPPCLLPPVGWSAKVNRGRST